MIASSNTRPMESTNNSLCIPTASEIHSHKAADALAVSDSRAEISYLVSHVPTTVSVSGSSVQYMSTNSSVSSAGLNATVDPLSRVGDSDSVSHVYRGPIQDSSNESSLVPVEESTTATSGIMTRKVSDTDISDVNSVSLSYKKRKTAHPTTEPGHVSPHLVMLGGPDDAKVLNPLHMFVRMQVEVFTATPEDMAQPAPGRKNPIRLHQVGLRCIHCKGLPARDRVKRAVCYPSSVGRVYHSASDMKFDHFSNCRGLKGNLRETFETLKAQCKRRGERGNRAQSSTAQYYHDSARLMGMEDGGSGIFMAGQGMASHSSLKTPQLAPPARPSASLCQMPPPASAPRQTKQDFTVSPALPSPQSPDIHKNVFPLPSFTPQLIAMAFQQSTLQNNTTSHGFHFGSSFSRSSMPEHPLIVPNLSNTSVPQETSKISPATYSRKAFGNSLLSSSMDTQYLNPLHCFVRRHVEVFAADKDDLSAPSPGRKNRVHVGQVGIRCIRCAHLPLKDRVKRAICYPPSVSGIYHAVSNMKFDHFAACRGLSQETRTEFTTLRANCNRRGGSTSNGARGMSNSTAQYYHDSALRLGLVDSAQGIRFREPRGDEDSQSCSDGISALMIAATNPTVRAEYERSRSTSTSSESNSTIVSAGAVEQL